ncbi:MAG: LptE family protein [Fibrobacteres bacterium]|nr:LptE family protein [Fibrobacterota bacterium]
MIRLLQILTLTLFTVLFSSACMRYSFSGTSLPAHIKSVSIPLFDNLTAKAGLEERIREQIWQAFQSVNVAEIRRADGDASLKLTIVDYTTTPDDYDVSGNVRSYKVTLTVEVDFFDTKENASLYKQKLSASGSYPFTGGTEEAGLKIAIGSLTEIILNNTLRGF